MLFYSIIVCHFASLPFLLILQQITLHSSASFVPIRLSNSSPDLCRCNCYHNMMLRLLSIFFFLQLQWDMLLFCALFYLQLYLIRVLLTRLQSVREFALVCTPLRCWCFSCHLYTLLVNYAIIDSFSEDASIAANNIRSRNDINISFAFTLCIITSSNNNFLLLLHIWLWWDEKHCVTSEWCVTCELQIEWCVRCVYLQLALTCHVIFIIIINTTLRCCRGTQWCIMTMCRWMWPLLHRKWRTK